MFLKTQQHKMMEAEFKYPALYQVGTQCSLLYIFSNPSLSNQANETSEGKDLGKVYLPSQEISIS